MNTKRHTPTLIKAATVILLLLSAGAFAQQSEDADEGEADKESAVEQKSATELDSVTVTVERREQDLQDYAGTAQSFSQDDLRGLGINNELRNLAIAVPGMNIANQEGNVEIFIRGVGSANSTELGDPGAAPSVNGNYIPRPRGLGAMFYDLERVEINKGPQGTLRGRNALAGTLNIITKRPQLGEVSGYFQGEVGNYSAYGAEGAYNFPLGDRTAMRVSGYHIDKDSSFNNVGEDQSLTPAGVQEESALRVSLLSEITDNFSMFMMADYGQEGGTGYPGANIYSAGLAGFTANDVDLRDIVYRGSQGDLDANNWGFQTNLSYDFGGAVLEYNGSYREVDFSQTNASSDGVLWDGRDVSAVDYDVYSSVYWQTRSQANIHELRLSSAQDQALRWTTGAFYFKEDQQVGFFSLADKGYCCYSGTEFTMPEVEGKSWAVFADGTFDVTDSFRLKAGVRYTDESKYRYGIGGNWALTLGGADYACCFATRLGTPGFVPALLSRPNFNVSDFDTPEELARFLLEGVLVPGSRDTLSAQLRGILDGTAPNGTCVVRPDTNNGFLTCSENGQHSFLSLSIPSQQEGRSADNYGDWRFGYEWDLGEDTLFYGSITTGHKAGGFNDSFDPNLIPETYLPESLISYELGYKHEYEFNGLPALFNFSGFYYDYSDQVFQDLTSIAVDDQGNATGFALANRNVGKSRLYGAELQSLLQFEHGFTLDVNALLLETEITRGVVSDIRSQNFGAGGITSSIDLEGNRLPLTSNFTLNARLQQAIELNSGTFDWQVLLAHRSAYYLTQFNNRDVVFISDTAGTVDRVESAREAGFYDKQDAYQHVNLGWGYTPLSGQWRVEGWVNNLFNQDVSNKALVGSGINVRFLNDARSYGARFRVYF